MALKSAFYLLLKDTVATQADDFHRKASPVNLSAGHLCFSKCIKSSHEREELSSCEIKNVNLPFKHHLFVRINESEFNLLLPIKSLADRINIAAEKNFFKNCIKIYELFSRLPSIEVYALISSASESLDESYGLVRYIGPIPQQSGFWFGVELPFVSIIIK